MIFDAKSIETASPQKIYYRMNEGMRKGNLLYSFSRKELHEYATCSYNPDYFIENYCKVWTPDGHKSLKLHGYQNKILKSFFTNKFNIVANARQTGLSELSRLMGLHEAIFGFKEKTVVFINLRLQDAADNMEKIQEIYKNLPFYMKPGVLSYDKHSINFDNGSRIKCLSSVPFGYNVDVMFIDSFAFMKKKKKRNFMRSAYPVMSALRDSKLFINSTPNGIEEFWSLLTDAERKDGDFSRNIFVPHRVYWWEVPGRSRYWAENEIRNMGQEAFDREYDLKFTVK